MNNTAPQHIAPSTEGAKLTPLPDAQLYRRTAFTTLMGVPEIVIGMEQAAATLAARFDVNASDITLALVAAYMGRVCEDGTASFALKPVFENTFRAVTIQAEAGDSFGEVIFRTMRQAMPGRDMPLADMSAQGETLVPVAVTTGVLVEEAVVADLHIHCGTNGEILLRAPAHNDPQFVERVANRLRAMAMALADDPALLVEDAPIMDRAERALVVNDWNATAANYPYRGGLVAMMERQARENPQAPALRFMEETITFSQFNTRVNQLARVLRAKGVGPDVFVGLCMERSVEMVVGLWAILKAGGAYVPLNTEDPAHRLAEIVEDCEPAAILTQARFASLFAEAAAPIMVVPEGGRYDPDGDVSNPAHEYGFNDLAYMIYTSGSTGKPKGVVVEHGAIHNRVVWMHEEYGLDASDRILQKTPYTFDVSVWEFLWSFAYGGTLVVAEPGGHMAMTYLYHTIKDEGVTHLHFVPSVLRMFLMIPSLKDLPIKKLFCSGEALPYATVQAFYGKSNDVAEVHNLYGPTEAAVDVSYYHCPRDGADPVIPIGRPVTNTSLLVLDEKDRPCPVGVPGELHIGGVQLARGYFKREDITSERFIDNPVADADHPRLYRTGDLAMVRPDGEIVYMGRNDFQVKINGVRMELGEIEAAIHEAAQFGGPIVRDVCVVAEEQAGNKVLVAYAVAEKPGEETAERLKAHVGETRPKTYIPREIRFLKDMPLTVSGKTDRKKLADWPRVV
ncbi:MAG: amino acid adenylation domain-containing protein [Pseudomonadota bacterium]